MTDADDLWQQAMDAQRNGDEEMTERLQDEAREAAWHDDDPQPGDFDAYLAEVDPADIEVREP